MEYERDTSFVTKKHLRYNHIKSVGLNVQDIVVFLDHEQGVKDRLGTQGYQAHSVLTISEITETLHQAGRIDQAQYGALAES